MLATVIVDMFRRDQTSELADALLDICASTDNYGWSSAGLYCFWDPYATEIRYIGLAADMVARFRQHTGLTECEPRSCKRLQIENHFAAHDYLGYSVFVQASLLQPLAPAVREKLGLRSAVLDEWREDGTADIRLSEGWLIRARQRLGEKPDWNRVGGSKCGAQYESQYEAALLGNFVAEPGPLLAHSSVRELSRDATLESYEETFHAARMHMLLAGVTLEEGLENVRSDYAQRLWHESAQRVDDLVRSGYLDKSPALPVITPPRDRSD